MRRDVAAVLLALALMVPAGLVMAEQGAGSEGSDGGSRPGASGNHTGPANVTGGHGNASGNRSDDGSPSASGDHGATGDGLVHRFQSANGTVTGAVASWDVDRTLPGIRDYAVNGTPALASVKLPAGAGLVDRTEGAHFTMGNDAARLDVLGTPNALLLLKVDTGNATLTLAAGVAATLLERGGQDGEGDDHEAAAAEHGGNASDGHGANASDDHGRGAWVLTLPGNVTALLSGDNLSFDGSRIFTATGHANVQFRLERPMASEGGEHDDEDEAGEAGDHGGHGPPDHVLEKLRAVRALDGRAEEHIAAALARGNITVEVTLGNGTEPLTAELAGVHVAHAAGHHGDVRASVDIEAPHGTPGTTVLLHLAAGDLRDLTLAQIAARLAVRFDGQNVTSADDLDDVFDAANDGGQPEYLLLVGAEQVQLLVSVPHFSSHTVEVVEEAQSLGATLVGVATNPVVVLVGMLAAAGVVGFTVWRRRNER